MTFGPGANQCARNDAWTFSRGSDGRCTKCGNAQGDHHDSSKYCYDCYCCKCYKQRNPDWNSACVACKNREKGSKPPQPSFATLDKDGDGHISPQEWAAYYQQTPPQAEEEDVSCCCLFAPRCEHVWIEKVLQNDANSVGGGIQANAFGVAGGGVNGHLAHGGGQRLTIYCKNCGVMKSDRRV